jgi:hypothetical protein
MTDPDLTYAAQMALMNGLHADICDATTALALANHSFRAAIAAYIRAADAARDPAAAEGFPATAIIPFATISA